jgi:hypothetical protein
LNDPNGCKFWVERPKPAASFGSINPNRMQGLGGTTQTAASFGLSDPNRLQNLGGTTQTGCKVWVEQYESSNDFYLSKFVHGFQGSGMSNPHHKYNTSQ